MINFDDVTKENMKENHLNWPQIPDHPYRILKLGGSESGNTNSLLSQISQESDIDKIYLHAKDPYKGKYKLFTNKRESADLKLLLNIQMI